MWIVMPNVGAESRAEACAVARRLERLVRLHRVVTVLLFGVWGH